MGQEDVIPQEGQGTFGVLPHDFGRGVAVHRAVQDPRLAIDTVLVVGLDDKLWRY